MKVYVKKTEKEYQSFLPTLLVSTVFLTFAGLIVYYTLQANSLIVALEQFGIGLLIAPIFGCLGALFLLSIFLPPMKYTGKLISKDEQQQDGRVIYLMTFQVFKKHPGNNDFTPDTYRCYSLEPNSLVVGSNYPIYIKNYIRKVNETMTSELKYAPSSSMIPVYIIIELFFIGQVVLGIIGIFNYPDYFWVFVIMTIIFTILIPYSIKKFIEMERNGIDIGQ